MRIDTNEKYGENKQIHQVYERKRWKAITWGTQAHALDLLVVE